MLDIDLMAGSIEDNDTIIIENYEFTIEKIDERYYVNSAEIEGFGIRDFELKSSALAYILGYVESLLDMRTRIKGGTNETYNQV